MDIELVDANDCLVTDSTGQEYLDLYGGHAVISVGHKHAHYVDRVEDQINKIAFYSNSVINKLQTELADKLGKLSSSKKASNFPLAARTPRRRANANPCFGSYS